MRGVDGDAIDESAEIAHIDSESVHCLDQRGAVVWERAVLGHALDEQRELMKQQKLARFTHQPPLSLQLGPLLYSDFKRT